MYNFITNKYRVLFKTIIDHEERELDSHFVRIVALVEVYHIPDREENGIELKAVQVELNTLVEELLPGAAVSLKE